MQSGCLFECQYLLAVQRCGCSPWNYPFHNATMPVCHHVGTSCFEEAMSEPSADCRCPSDCSSVTFPYHVVAQATNLDMVCRKGRAALTAFARNDMFFLDGLEEKASSQWDLCRRELESVAVLRVHVASRFISRVTRTSRITFTGQLASLGTVNKLRMVSTVETLISDVFSYLFVEAHVQLSHPIDT